VVEEVRVEQEEEAKVIEGRESVAKIRKADTV
jgi:hypothetical protein